MEKVLFYVGFIVLVAYLGWRRIQFMAVKKQVPQMVEHGAIIIDVRSPEEFRSGNNPKSINIPVNDFMDHIDRLDKNKPVVLCCASGGRSGVAAAMLKSRGFANVVNAGAWSNTLES